MTVKRLSAILIAPALLIAAIVYLFATGERGLTGGDGRSLSPFQPRDVETFRADDGIVESLGWSPASLDRMLDYLSRLSVDSFIVQTEGATVATLGRLDEPHAIHSMRKAILSALVGQHIGDGPSRIPLDATLRELGIDDDPGPLTALQRQATVLHLLKSTSGINHPAAAEGGLMTEKQALLGDGEHPPGTVWAYNNWDYNALTTIFERRTGKSIPTAFLSGLATPLGLQDVTDESVAYIEEPDLSRHKAVMFELSARDLVRIGQLYLDRGAFDGAEIVPAAWIDRIVSDHSQTGIEGLRAGHGYLWWIPSPDTGLPEGSYFAWGLGQQSLFVIPAWKTAVVHQSDTEELLRRWSDLKDEGKTPQSAFEEAALGCHEREDFTSEFCREHRFTGRREFDRLISLIVAARRDGQ